MLFVERLGVAPDVDRKRIMAICQTFHTFAPDGHEESAFFQFPFSFAEYNRQLGVLIGREGLKIWGLVLEVQ
jgi:hypothetical protein